MFSGPERSDCKQVSNPSLLWTSHYQSVYVSINLVRTKRTKVQIGWRVYMIDGDIMDSPTQVGLGCGDAVEWFFGGLRRSVKAASDRQVWQRLQDAQWQWRTNRRKLEFADEKLQRHGETWRDYYSNCWYCWYTVAMIPLYSTCYIVTVQWHSAPLKLSETVEMDYIGLLPALQRTVTVVFFTDYRCAPVTRCNAMRMWCACVQVITGADCNPCCPRIHLWNTPGHDRKWHVTLQAWGLVMDRWDRDHRMVLWHWIWCWRFPCQER